jgi:hypothetical protein
LGTLSLLAIIGYTTVQRPSILWQFEEARRIEQSLEAHYTLQSAQKLTFSTYFLWVENNWRCSAMRKKNNRSSSIIRE